MFRNALQTVQCLTWCSNYRSSLTLLDKTVNTFSQNPSAQHTFDLNALTLNNYKVISTMLMIAEEHWWIIQIKEKWKIQQVDDIYTKTLHPYSWSSKHNRSKSHQNTVQQSTQNKSDFNDIRGTNIYGKVTNTAQESKGMCNEKPHSFYPSFNLLYENLMRRCLLPKSGNNIKAMETVFTVTEPKVDENWC